MKTNHNYEDTTKIYKFQKGRYYVYVMVTKYSSIVIHTEIPQYSKFSA